ncbi:SUR7/PalI family-domain-containing protein [Tirmania nivea]|nr:SUR7/PalI family-domain-containing protein [Tirmania nivea]
MALIRPATVLSFLLFIAFGCLLVSTLSAPIVKQIALATNNNVTFGVFGYCISANNAQVCTGITLGYNVDSLSAPRDFTLPSKARLTLTNLLVIHPIGALLVLILLVLTLVSHFYGPGHSPGYLLFLVYFSIFTCVVAILAFLVDILLFVPHLSAGGYIVVGAPICLAIVVVGLCATRRRVVGKQDRKRRIAETANTNNIDTSSNAGYAAEHSSTGDAGKSEFASFEVGKPGSDGPGLDETGERIPLNPRHQSPPPGMSMHQIPTENSQGDYGQAVGGSPLNFPSRLPSRGANQYNAGPLPPPHRLPLSNQYSQGTGAFGPSLGAPQYGPPRYGLGGPYRGGPSPKPGYGGPRAPPQNDYALGDQGRNAVFPGPHNGPPMRGFNDGNQYGVSGPFPRGLSLGMQGIGPRRGPSPQQQAQGYPQVSPISPTDARGQAPEPVWSSQQYGQQQQQKQQLDVEDYPSDDDSRVDAESRVQPSRQDFVATALAPGHGSGGGRVAEPEAPASLDGPTPNARLASFLSEDGNR